MQFIINSIVNEVLTELKIMEKDINTTDRLLSSNITRDRSIVVLT